MNSSLFCKFFKDCLVCFVEIVIFRKVVKFYCKLLHSISFVEIIEGAKTNRPIDPKENDGDGWDDLLFCKKMKLVGDVFQYVLPSNDACLTRLR
jgi:hypothetical protein